jgi:hypothetical protein
LWRERVGALNGQQRWWSQEDQLHIIASKSSLPRPQLAPTDLEAIEDLSQLQNKALA